MAARRRMIDPDIWYNERFNELPDGGRLLFIGMFSNADDDGRLKAAPKYLKAHIFPYDEKSLDDIKNWRDQCEKVGIIKTYTYQEVEYLYLPGWREHQVIRHDTYHKSTIPAPDGQLALNDTPVTGTLQHRNGDATTPLPNKSNQSSQV